MAERTGIPSLDALLSRFAAQKQNSRLREAGYASGLCFTASERFIEFLCRHKWNGEAYLSGGHEGSNPLAYELITAQELGYGDRSISGWEGHTLVLIEHESDIYSVDFTCAQYGYSEFPLVQRLDDTGWVRDFLSSEREMRQPVLQMS